MKTNSNPIQFLKELKDIVTKLGYVYIESETNPVPEIRFATDDICVHYACVITYSSNTMYWASNLKLINNNKNIGIRNIQQASIEDCKIPDHFEDDLKTCMQEYKLLCTEIKKVQIETDFK